MSLQTKDTKEKKNIQQEENLGFFESVSIFFFNFFRIMGMYAIKKEKFIKRNSKIFYEKFLKSFFHKIDMFTLTITKKLSRFYKGILYKIYMFFKFFIDAYKVVRNGYNLHKNKSVLSRFKYATIAFLKGVRNNLNIFATAFNYLLPVAAVIGLFCVISYVKSLNYAVSVEYNGKHVGFVENETVFEKAETKLQQRILYLQNDKVIENTPKFTVAVIDQKKLKSDTDLTDSMIQTSSEDIVKATGLSIDGQFFGAVKDGDKLKKTLDSLLNKHKTNRSDEEVKFTKDVKTETGFFVSNNIVDENKLLSILTGETAKDIFYTVEEGDTPIMIAASNDMDLDDLVRLNPDILKDCKIGKQVLVNKSQAFLPVSVIRTETYKEEIPFDIEYSYSNSYYEGYSAPIRAGIKGEQEITAKVEYVDGVEIGKTILSKNITKQPVTQQTVKGTKVPEKSENFKGSSSSYGFAWPLYSPIVTSPFGPRGRSFHTGIDISQPGGSYGSPIYASMPGRVITAGWHYSYGNHVIIDHGGGVTTLYAHASRLYVRRGQIVKQGDQIASVGNTGSSYGAHCHFEVRFSGVHQNPRKFLP